MNYTAGKLYEVDPKELKFNASNRKVDPKHVNKLKLAMKENNLLHINPLKVTKSLEVIDGQHRAHAAIELNFKVVPVLVVQASVHDAAMLNQNSKNWDAMDFAKYWASRDVKDYQEFIEFVALTDIKPSVAMTILGCTDGAENKQFREGLFKIRSTQYAFRFIERLEGFKDFLPSYHTRTFLRAFWRVFNRQNFHYDHERMMHKVGIVGLRATTDMNNYVEQLENIYNYKVPMEQRVRFQD